MSVHGILKMRDSHQTYINDALWGREERLTFCGQKVKVQGRGGITYAENRTFRAEVYSTRRSIVELRVCS